jgi:hypothetical protein
LPGEHDIGHGVNKHLGPLPPVLRVPDPECVSGFVYKDPDLRVGGELLVDDDLPPARVAPAAGWPVDLPVVHLVAQLAGEPLERHEKVRVALARNRLARRR